MFYYMQYYGGIVMEAYLQMDLLANHMLPYMIHAHKFDTWDLCDNITKSCALGLYGSTQNLYILFYAPVWSLFMAPYSPC